VRRFHRYEQPLPSLDVGWGGGRRWADCVLGAPRAPPRLRALRTLAPRMPLPLPLRARFFACLRYCRAGGYLAALPRTTLLFAAPRRQRALRLAHLPVRMLRYIFLPLYLFCI